MSDSEDDVMLLSETAKPAAPAKKVAAKKPAAAKTKAATGKKPAAKKKPVAKKKAVKKRKNPCEEDDETSSSSSETSQYGGKGDDDDEDMEEDGPKQSIEQIYQKKTQLEHILLRPDTYVGSIEPVTQSMWVFDDASSKMDLRKITFVPGLYKIFDEIIVNACDNKQRDKTMDTLKVTIDVENGEISVWNNGKGIPIALHKEHKVYVPELIFGHLLTGSNFDDKKKKTTGGRNGYGAKLANIFSTEFVVETADSSLKKRYKQVFSNNMSDKGEPVISSWSRKDFTCISFKPDLHRFKMEKLDGDIVALFKKRVYDVAGVTDKSLNVYLNGEKISIKSFPQYVELYRSKSDDDDKGNDKGSDSDNDEGLEDKEKEKKRKKKDDEVIFDKPDSRWQVGVAVSDDGFQQVSFVNGICTTKGGQHVNYITDQIVAKLVAVVKKRNKGEAVKPNYIKNHITVYISALIDNPAFDSQTKETLTTRPPAFGSTYTLSERFLKQIEKCGVVERIVSFAQFKQTAELRRKAGGATGRRTRLTGIPKLDDANFAGSAKGKDCTLLITEGDSAKTIAVGGLSVVGRDYYGVFPLRGKLLNVREASHTQIMKNEELNNLVKILGLKYGQDYSSTKGLRYGHLMIMTDQDHDGSHIKGLVINWIHHFWPSLLKVEGFLQEFITPIVKCTKGSSKHVFYTMPEYEAWRDAHNSGRGWHIKYYKGLGTSTTAEAKEYFSDLKTHQIDFSYDGEQDDDVIDMAFSKKRVEERKDWLRGHEIGTYVDYDVDEMGYTEFVNKELILFSMADNIRSIPCVVDGFKPSQRKVLFCCFKRNLKVELKVAQLGGYVSEHSAYHHGEQSLYGTIINMAQDFVGSNNTHLLSPNGQFGTRLMGGKDAASPRYIFTNLEQVTRLIFDARDNDVLKYLDEDGQSIEPEWYIPVIPMALVNGSEGIGTGWSSSIPNYNPFDIINILRHKIRNEETSPLIPWYRGFIGHIVPKPSTRGGTDSQNFLVQGLYEVMDETTLVISELPVKMWTQTYKQFLEGLLEAGTIKDFKENHTDTKVLFTITLEEKTLRDITSAPGGIIKKFKLESSLSTSNMHLFDAYGHIKKYETPEEILDEFYGIRIDFYDRRKRAMLRKLADQIKLLSNKSRFVLSVVEGQLIVNNRKKQDLMKELVNEGYDQILPQSVKRKAAADNDDAASEEEEEDVNTADASRGYDYLLSMKIWSLTKERVEKLQKELHDREQEYQELEAKTVEELWLADLDALEVGLREAEEERERIMSRTPKLKKSGKGRKPAAKRKKRTKAGSDEDEDEDDDDDSDFEMDRPKKKARAPAKPRAKPAAKPPATKKEPAAATATKEPTATAKKKAPSKSDGKKKATTITAFFGAKKEPESDEKGKDSGSDVEVLSLAERLARRTKETPQKKPKAPARAAPVDLVDSDKEDGSGKSKPAQAAVLDDEDDVFAMDVDDNEPAPKEAAVNATALKTKAAPKAKAAAKKAPAARAKPVKAATSALEMDDQDDEELSDAPAPVKTKAPAKRQKAAASAKKQKQKQKQKLSEAETEESADEAVNVAPPRRGGRVRKRIVYVEPSSGEEEDDVEVIDDGDDDDDAGSDFSAGDDDSD